MNELHNESDVLKIFVYRTAATEACLTRFYTNITFRGSFNKNRSMEIVFLVLKGKIYLFRKIVKFGFRLKNCDFFNRNNELI